MPLEMTVLIASFEETGRKWQRFMLVKYRRPVMGFGELGTNSHKRSLSPLMGRPVEKPSRKLCPYSSGKSSTFANMPESRFGVTSNCFHVR